MPTFKFSCPHCDQHIEAGEKWRGQTTNCPTCGEEIIVDDVPLSEGETANDDKNRICINGKPNPSTDEIRKLLNSCRRGIIPSVLLSFDENNFLTVSRHDYYVITWMDNGNCFVSVSTSLTFKKVTEVFDEYYSGGKSLNQIIHWNYKSSSNHDLVSSKMNFSENDKTPSSMMLNGRPCYSFDEVKKALLSCKKGFINKVTLKSIRPPLSVTKYNNYWIESCGITLSLNFYEVVDVFYTYYFFDDSFRDELKKQKDKQDNNYKTMCARNHTSNCSSYKSSISNSNSFFNTDPNNLGCGYIIFLIISLILGIIIMNSCDIKSSNNNDSSSTMSEKDFREYDKVRLKSNDPLDWRKEEEALPSDSHSPSIEELRRIEDPDKAEAYFRENMTSLLKEAWDKEQQKRK